MNGNCKQKTKGQTQQPGEEKGGEKERTLIEEGEGEIKEKEYK